MSVARAIAASMLLCAALAAGAQESGRPLDRRARAEDFDALWRALDQGYAYFGSQRPAWRRTLDLWKPRAVRAGTRAEFLHALEGAISRLHDDHVVLSESAPDSPRRVPAQTDIWAHWRDEAALIEAVRTYGEADVAGLHPGQVIRSIGGLPTQRAVRDLLGDDTDAAALDWALRHALAGPRNGTLRLEASEARGPVAYEIARAGTPAPNGPPLIGRRIGEGRDLGYIRLKAPLSDLELAAQFDDALNYLKGTRALILDLREATGPFAEPARARTNLLAIIGRFIEKPAAWQAREPRAGERIEDMASPRAPAYRAPLVVLVDRWTAGEGEALAAGLQAAARAKLVGTRMAGLRGEPRDARLPHSGIVLRYPAQRTFHPDGTPRESLRPDVFVDLAAPQGGPGDPILYQALKLLEK